MSVLAEKHLASVGISPVASDDFGFGECQPAFRAGLGVERARRWPVDTIRSLVACVPPSRRQFTDPAKASFPGHQAALLREQVTGATRPASTKSASAVSLMRTCRPTLWNSIRRS